MGIITRFNKNVFSLFVFLFLLGMGAESYSQCPTITNPIQSFCDSQSPTVASLVATNNGGGIKWYADATSAAADFLLPSTTLISGENYFVDDNTGACGTRQSVIVTIVSRPIALLAATTLCKASFVSDLNAFVLGNNIKWYTTSTGGTALNQSDSISNGTYYASQTNPVTGCETTRTPIIVQVLIVSPPTGDAIQTFCVSGTPTIANLTANGTNVSWYASQTSGFPLSPTTPLINGQIYFAESFLFPCPSTSRLQVTVVLNQANNAGGNAVKGFCESTISSQPAINLFNQLSGTPYSNGAWTGPIATSNGHLGTLNVSSLTSAGSPYVFTYTVSNLPCPDAISTVTINVIPQPVASVSVLPTTICQNSSATITFTGTPNAIVTYNINGGGNQTITLSATGTATISNTFTANTIINIVSVASSGIPSCINTTASSVTLNVLPLPTATVNVLPTTICQNSSATITFTGTPNAIVTYNVNGGGNQTITLNASGTATISNTFSTNTIINIVSVASSGTPSCINTTPSSVTLNVLPLPTATVSVSPTTICQNSSATITFTGTPDAIVTYNINGGGNQTITLSATGTATIVNTFSTNTVINIVSVASSGTPSCINNAQSSVTLTIRPLPTATVNVAPTTICQNSSATITFTGTPNAIVTYNINGGANQTITLNASGTATINNTFTANTVINIVSVASSGTPSCINTTPSSVTLTVLPLPTASVSVAPTTICQNSSATITFTGTPNAIVTYNINGGANQTITLNASGTATIVNTFSTSTIINIVSVASSGTPSCINTTASSVTLTVLPLPTASVSVAPTTICQNSSATITFTGTPNAIVTYTINGGTNQTITLSASGTATINNTFTANTVINIVSVASSGTPSCINTTPSSVTLTVLPLPTATVSVAPTTICQNSSATITFTGTLNAIVIYNINGGGNQTITLSASGTATISNTFSTNTIINIVSVTSSGTPSCVNTTPSSVTLNVLPLPTATVSVLPTTICQNSSATITFTGTPNAIVTYNINGGGNQTITLNASGTATIVNTFSTNTVINIVSVTSSGTPSCVNTTPSSVTLNVLPLPTATVSVLPTTICQNSSATITFTGTPNAIVIYNINGGGNQTITLNASGTATIVNTFSTNTIINIVSVASSGTPSCVNTTPSSVTLNVLPLPTASVSVAPMTICQNSSATITFTGTPNAIVTYNINGGGNQTITLSTSGTATISNTFSTNTIINIVSVASSGTPSCINNTPSSVTLNVLPLPTATVNVAPTTICQNSSATITFTGTPNAIVTYNINGGGNQTITLSASGTATINNTFAANTIINIVSVASSGTPSCINTTPSSVTLNVLPLPTATVSVAPTTICQNSSATITFTGTPNAIVTYNINGGTNQTITLNASGTATIVNTFSTNTIINIVSVASSGTPSCINTTTSSVTLNVLPLPTAIVSVLPTTICQNETATITFTGTPNAIVTFNINGAGNQTITLNASGTATITNTFSANTVINIVSVATSGTPGCVNTMPSSVTLNVLPLPTATVNVLPTTICQNSSATITFTGTPNAIVNYNINNGTNQTIVLNALGTATIVNTFSANTVINIVSVASSGTPSCVNTTPSSVTLNVLPLPTVSISVAPTTICQNSSATITFAGTPNAMVTYNINGGTNQTITLNASGTATINNTFSANTIINIVSVATSGTPSCVNTTPSSVTILTVAPPIAGVTPSPLSLCVNSPIVDLFTLLGATAQAGGTWSPVLASGTGVFNPAVDVSGTYTYTVVGNPLCPPASVSVQVTVNPIPYAGVDGTLNICSNQNSVDLFSSLNGTPQTGGTWSPALASGTGIFNPAVDTSAIYTYTIAGISPCIDDTATVTVTVVPGPEAGNDSALTLCQNSAAQDLFVLLGPNAQTGGTWSPALTSGTGVFDPSVDTAGIYVYTLAGPNPCDNDQATITVTINPVPDAGIDGAHLFCTNDAAQDLFSFLNGTPQTGGTWSPALASGTGVFNPILDTAGVYTYTVGGGNCDTATAQVTVTIVQSPIAGQDGQIQACADDTSIELTSGLDGTQGLGIFADDDATGALSGTTFNPSLVVPGTYNFTYTVSGGTSPCLTDTAIVTVVVNALPNAGTFVPIAPICASAGTLDLNSLLTGQDVGGEWSDANGTVTSPIDVSAFAEGTYSFDYSVTNFCDTSVTTVEFTILPIPTILNTNVSITPICIGADALITLSGMVDGTYTLNYNLSGSNVLANQTIQVTVVGGNATFTILGATIPNSGTTLITFTGIGNTVTNCIATPSNVTGTIIINPLVTIDDTNITVANACLNSEVVVVVSSAANLTDGTYQFDYSITGGVVLSGNSGDFVVTSGNGQFTIPATTFPTVGNYTITINAITSTTQCSNTTITATASFDIVEPIVAGTFNGIISVCPSSGTIDLASLLDNESTGGVWTDVANQTVTSPLNISSFAPGTYSYTYTVSNACGTDDEAVQFTILANPQIATSNIAIAPACLGVDVVVNLNGMTDGTYTLTYDLTGTNTAAAQTATVTITAGVGNFTVPTSLLPNTGITVISFTNIINTATNCSNTVVNVSDQINIRPKADIDNSNISVASVCFGENIIVSILNAVNLPDGVYQFDYSISGGVVLSGNSGDVTITGGNGQFQLNSTLFPTTGNYAVTIISITSAALCPNTNENAVASFSINPAPNTAGANLSAETTCLNFSSAVTISNATGLADGSYTIIYDLSGANTASATIVITVVSGQATFTIPATSLVNAGDTTITITDIMSDTTLCMATGATLAPFTFSVAELGTPVLVDKGYEFCDTDNPTIADLSANIVGNPTVIWYNAASGGTAYNPTDALVNGTTYYAALVSQSGCEGTTRLEVKVDTTVCTDLIIPDGFSPNNDGINDDFHIVNLDVLYPDFKLEVYNRYGNLLYTGNKNTPRWDGTTTEKSLRVGSSTLPTGVYFFIIYFNDGTRNPYQGRVYLNR